MQACLEYFRGFRSFKTEFLLPLDSPPRRVHTRWQGVAITKTEPGRLWTTRLASFDGSPTKLPFLYIVPLDTGTFRRRKAQNRTKKPLHHDRSHESVVTDYARSPRDLNLFRAVGDFNVAILLAKVLLFKRDCDFVQRVDPRALQARSAPAGFGHLRFASHSAGYKVDNQSRSAVHHWDSVGVRDVVQDLTCRSIVRGAENKVTVQDRTNTLFLESTPPNCDELEVRSCSDGSGPPLEVIDLGSPHVPRLGTNRTVPVFILQDVVVDHHQLSDAEAGEEFYEGASYSTATDNAHSETGQDPLTISAPESDGTVPGRDTFELRHSRGPDDCSLRSDDMDDIRILVGSALGTEPRGVGLLQCQGPGPGVFPYAPSPWWGHYTSRNRRAR